MIASDVTDLPQPDSPTTPTVWPGCTSKLMPLTATKGSSPWRRKVTRRSRTDSSGSVRRAETLAEGCVAVLIGYLRLLGSRASRSDSPMSVKPSATMMMQIAG